LFPGILHWATELQTTDGLHNKNTDFSAVRGKIQTQPGASNKYIKTCRKGEEKPSELGCLEEKSDTLLSLTIVLHSSSSTSEGGGSVCSEEHLEVTTEGITISDPESWPVKLTDLPCVSVVKQAPAKPYPTYEYAKEAVHFRLL
jgi:hypothetical protein